MKKREKMKSKEGEKLMEKETLRNVLQYLGLLAYLNDLSLQLRKLESKGEKTVSLEDLQKKNRRGHRCRSNSNRSTHLT